MKSFVLDSDSLRKGWGGTDQFWFSLKDYSIRDILSLSDMDRPDDVSQTAYFLSLGYIPYFVVSNEEIMRAFVSTLTNAKLKNAFSKIDDNKYVESFWKYFNIYPELSENYNSFEDEYVLNKAIAWCEQNSIEYVTE